MGTAKATAQSAAINLLNTIIGKSELPCGNNNSI